MIRSIVVGTDGSDTARKAVQEAADLANQLGAGMDIVSAYAPVSSQRLRDEARQAPEKQQWMVTPREDVDAKLNETKDLVEGAGVQQVIVHSRDCNPADAILDVAEEQGSD